MKKLLVLAVMATVLTVGGSAARASDGGLSVTVTGRNVTRGQSGEYWSVSAGGGDTLDIIVRIRNTSAVTLTNIFITDILPFGLNYVPRSTTLNGFVVSDNVTSFGIVLGALSPGQEATTKLSAVVDPRSVPVRGRVEVDNVAHVRADGTDTVSPVLPVSLGIGQSLAAVSRVKTGPADSIILSLLVSVLVTAGYGAYTTTELFGRRHALAVARAASGRPSALNFIR